MPTVTRRRAAAGEQVRHIADARVAITAKPKVLRVLLAFFQAPLAKRASERNGNDSRDVELALTLLRNLVAPLPKVNDHIDAIVDSSWDELVAALDKELMFEIVAALAAAVRRRENETLNLMLVEIFAALFTQHAPADVVAAEFNDNAISSAIEHEVWQSEKRVAKGPLVEALRRERSSRVLETSTRHPRFGSLLRLPPAPGTEGDMGDCVSGVTALASRAALLTGGITSTVSLGCASFLIYAGKCRSVLSLQGVDQFLSLTTKCVSCVFWGFTTAMDCSSISTVDEVEKRGAWTIVEEMAKIRSSVTCSSSMTRLMIVTVRTLICRRVARPGQRRFCVCLTSRGLASQHAARFRRRCYAFLTLMPS